MERAHKAASAPGRREKSAWRDFKERLRHKFADPELLALALTHSSWANEAGHAGRHNERLEFLGDAVLELCVSDELCRRFPDAREGDLTRMRSRLVNESSLAAIAREIGLPDALRLGVGEERQDGRQRDSILCDALEALLAAIYMDGGISAAYDFVREIFAERWRGPESDRIHEKDFKSRLQEFCRRNFQALPIYLLEDSSGPEHAKIFTTRLALPDGKVFRASESSCKKAEQLAASLALKYLGAVD